MKKGWSEELKTLTRNRAGDGALLKNESYTFGFYATRPEGGIQIMGVKTSMGFPLPSDTVIARFSDIDDMISAGWVLD